VWTRGRDFPLSLLEIRLRCPRCGARRVRSFSSRRKVVRGSEDSVIQCRLSPVVFAAIRRVSSLGSDPFWTDLHREYARQANAIRPSGTSGQIVAFKNPGLRRFACPTDPHGADQCRRKAKRPKRKKDHYKSRREGRAKKAFKRIDIETKKRRSKREKLSRDRVLTALTPCCAVADPSLRVGDTSSPSRPNQTQRGVRQ